MGAEGKESRCKGCIWWFISFVILALVVGAIVLTFLHKKNSGKHEPRSRPPAPGPPGAISAKYSKALQTALTFFDIQKAGKLPADNPINWRGNSALTDGQDVKADLSKGLYDAGDHIKFGLPLAFTATLLSWSVLEYGDQMQVVSKQNARAVDAIQWITDYLIDAHPSPNVLYIQVGDATVDHKCWERPEDMKENRPTLQVNESNPGSDVAAETAAAMASASLVFRSSDPAYSKQLLQHAKELFSFADSYRGLYSESVPSVQTFYNSTGYQDELLWAAAWLYHATGDIEYLNYVSVKNGKAYANWFAAPTWFSWDSKHAGVQVLLSRLYHFQQSRIANDILSDIDQYKMTADAIMCAFLPDSPSATINRTTGGLLWITEWNCIQHAAGSAFLSVIYSDYLATSRSLGLKCGDKEYTADDLRDFAASQADYILGSNHMKMSYLVGYGTSYPKQVHHRGASIPADSNTDCKSGMLWLNANSPNPNVATGGVVGGPFQNDSFNDVRDNPMQNEPTTYNSAAMVGLLAGLVTKSSVVQSFTQ